MRRTILLSLFALLALSAANNACAQRRGQARPGHIRSGSVFNHARRGQISTRARGRHNFNRTRGFSPYGFGYAYLPYDSGPAYASEPQPDISVEQPPQIVPPPAPPVVEPPVHPVFKEYKWPAKSSTSSQSEPQSFAIVLKDGSTLSADTVFVAGNDLHFVDPDERHLRISMSEVDRASTLKINHARNLNLYLPAAQ